MPERLLPPIEVKSRTISQVPQSNNVPHFPDTFEAEKIYDIVEFSPDNLFAMFQQETGDHRLLTAEEEIEMGQAVQQAKAAEAALQAGEETDQILACIEKGRRAKEVFVRHNLKLVTSVAKKYQGHGLSIEDLVQEGTIGLIKGIEGYDPERGFRFSTYATWWVRQGVTRALADKGTTIRLPIQVHEEINRVKRISRQFETTEGREPTNAELAEILAISETHLTDLNNAVTKTNIESLQKKVMDSEREVGEMIPDAQQVSIEEQVEESDQRAIVQKILELGGLSDREKEILSLRCGLKTGEPQTFKTISENKGVTRERIRQIEVGALKKIRANPLFKQMVKEYLE